jgi:hypothetical protein
MGATVTAKVPENASLIRAAIEAGKHIYREWPLALNAAQARCLTALAAARAWRSAGRRPAGVSGARRAVRAAVDRRRRAGEMAGVSIAVTISGLGARQVSSRMEHDETANGAI